MSQVMDANPLEGLPGQPDEEREQQRRQVEEAVHRREAARARFDRVLADARLLSTLRAFQRARLGDYSRIVQYFGTTHSYDPRHPAPTDYALYLELQWSDEPLDFGAEDTPPGCYTIQLQVMSDGDGEGESIAFPVILQRYTPDDWQRDPGALRRALDLAHEHAMHARKRTTQAYRFPWGIQTIYDIEML